MLPKSFKQQNVDKKNLLISRMKLYTITYDYILTHYYGEYIKDSYNKWGNIVDNLGMMKLTGYKKNEAEANFNQLMEIYYINNHKIKGYEIINIEEESLLDETIF
jgi:hypothetical protein